VIRLDDVHCFSTNMSLDEEDILVTSWTRLRLNKQATTRKWWVNPYFN